MLEICWDLFERPLEMGFKKKYVQNAVMRVN